MNEKEVIEEIKRWSASVLEQTSDNYNGLPVCPYAKKAWRDNKVGFIFKKTKSWKVLYKAIDEWDDSKEVIILVDHDFFEFDAFYEFLDNMNESISKGKHSTKDMFLMGFHPESDDNDLLDDEIEMTDEEPYAIVFLQRLTKLQEASDQLREKGYYDTCEEYYGGSSSYHQRQEYYRRLKWQGQKRK